MREILASELRAKDLNPLFNDPAVVRALEMLGLDPHLTQDNILLWIDSVKNVESSGGTQTSNKERVGDEDGTTAKGNYQFTDATYKSYLQSYKNALADVDQKLPVWAESEYKAGDDRDPRRLTDLQQQILLVVGTHARGKDEEIVPAWTGDLEDAGVDLFYDVHYAGAPDLITRFVVNREFKKNADKVVKVIDEDPVKEPEPEPVVEEYTDLNDPEDKPSVEAQQLGNLNIEDYAPESTPLGASDFDFDTANKEIEREGMLASLGVSVPKREKVTVPQPSLKGTAFGFTDKKKPAQSETSIESSLKAIQDGILNPQPKPKPKETAPDLTEIIPTQRGQVPIPQPKQPAPAPKPRVRPESEPRIESELAAMQAGVMEPKRETAPDLEEIIPTQRGQVPIPQKKEEEPAQTVQLTPDESESAIQSTLFSIQDSIINAEQRLPEVEKYTPGPNALVEEPTTEVTEEDPEPVAEKNQGWGGFSGVRSAPVEIPKLDMPLNMEAVFEGARIKSERDQKFRKGITRSIMEGATFNLYDELDARLKARTTGMPYDLARTQYRTEQNEFKEMNPDASLTAELAASIIPGIQGYKALQAGSKGLNKLGQSVRLRRGQDDPLERVLYTPAPKTKLRYQSGKLRQYTDETPRYVSVVDDLGNGKVVIKDANGKVFPVNKKTLAERSTKAEVGPASNMTLGAIEGGFWGFGAGEGDSRIDEVVVGTLAGLTMGKVIDWFAKPDFNMQIGSAADESLMISGMENAEVVNEIRRQSGKALQEAQNAKFAPEEDGVMEAMLGGKMPTGPAPFSYLDTFNESKLAKKGPAREGMLGVWDKTVEKYKDLALGISDRLMVDFSPEWGARVQVGDETALRLLSREITEFVDPVAKVLDLEESNQKFHGLLLDYAKGESSLDEVVAFVQKELGQDMADATRRHIEWANIKNQSHIEQITGRKYSLPSYLSTKLSKKAKAEKGNLDRDMDLPDDPGMLSRSRGNYKDGDVDPADYDPVLATNFRRIMNNERLVQIARKMNMPQVKNMKTADDYFATMEQHVIDMGLDPDLAKRGTAFIKENLVGQIRSPAAWIQALNSFGYASTLAGPMSALLNLHDPMVASVKYGLRNTLKGVTQPRYDVRARGIDQNVGEFMNKVIDVYSPDRNGLEQMIADAMRTGTDWLMKGSGFAAMDNMGKSGTIKAVLNNAAELAAKDSKRKWKKKSDQFVKGELAKAWGFYFNRAELDIINRELMKHGGDFTKYSGRAGELLEELGFAGLGQQQLISGMGRPAAWARHPNLRPMWALRGFAIKQQALILREIMFHMAAGRTDEAIKYFARYIALAAGSFGLLNEARQWVFGDGEASFPGFLVSAADQVLSTLTLNTVGLNDYQYGRLMESGPIPVIAESLFPLPASRIMDIGKSMYQGATDPTKQFRTEIIDEVPTLRQPLNALQNVEENTGLIPDPLANLEATIRPGEQR
jgi:hypothetical protein